MIDRITPATTALAVIGVAVVSAIISCRPADELVCSRDGSGTTARLVPLTVDGLISAASRLILDFPPRIVSRMIAFRSWVALCFGWTETGHPRRGRGDRC